MWQLDDLWKWVLCITSESKGWTHLSMQWPGSAVLYPIGQRSGGVAYWFVANLGHGHVQPRWLEIAIVPLVEKTNKTVSLLAEDALDRLTGEAGCGDYHFSRDQFALIRLLCQLCSPDLDVSDVVITGR